MFNERNNIRYFFKSFLLLYFRIVFIIICKYSREDIYFAYRQINTKILHWCQSNKFYLKRANERNKRSIKEMLLPRITAVILVE